MRVSLIAILMGLAIGFVTNKAYGVPINNASEFAAERIS